MRKLIMLSENRTFRRNAFRTNYNRLFSGYLGFQRNVERKSSDPFKEIQRNR